MSSGLGTSLKNFVTACTIASVNSYVSRKFILSAKTFGIEFEKKTIVIKITVANRLE